MKNSLKQVLAVGAIASLGLLGCQDDDTIYNVAVYTTLDTNQVYSLYVDGDLRGAVPFSYVPISCDSTERLASCLNFPLESGRHKFELWNESGATVSSFSLRVSETKTSGSAGQDSGSEVHKDGNCLVVNMF